MKGKRSPANRAPAPATKPNHAELLARALRHHQIGQIAEAEAIYRQILHLDAAQYDALHLLGVLAHQQGDEEAAEELIGKAIAQRADVPAFHFNLGTILSAQGKYAEAVASFDRALAYQPFHAEAHTNLGGSYFKMGAMERALASYRRVLICRPDFPDGQKNLGMTLLALADPHEAARSFRRAVAHLPDVGESHHYLGAALHQRGELAEAVRSFRRALVLAPAAPEALGTLAVALQLGQCSEQAVAFCRMALAVRPDDAKTHHCLGRAWQDLDGLTEALAAFDAVLALRAGHVDALFDKGNVLQRLGRMAEALHCYRLALAQQPAYGPVYSNFANLLKEQGDFARAITYYRRALTQQPDLAVAHSNLGDLLREQGHRDPAADYCRRALILKPDSPHADNNLGITLREQGRLAAAESCLRRALIGKPDFAMAHNNLGTALQEQDRLDDAFAAYQSALSFDPDYADAHGNLALLLLLRGCFAEGWREYEWRWRVGALRLPAWTEGKPQWQGEALAGRTIVLHAEQGLGDAIHFCRYAPLVAERGGFVVLQVHRPLVKLMGRLSGVAAVVAKGESLPPFDLHCPLMSLPGVFGTDLASIPAPIPYLAAEPERVARWRERLPDGFRIGIVWAGSPGYKSDRSRSVPLAQFAPLAGIPGVRLISLQKMHGLDQLHDLPDGMSVATLGADFDEGDAAFLDSAAVMMSLDLIVTVDSAIGHLAGALGRKVWLILSAVPHWPWLLERDDTPWYPHTQLFRSDDWSISVQRMADSLTEIVADLPSRLSEGLAFQRGGRLVDAERCFRQVLSACPDHPDALHLLGTLAHISGHDAEAIDLIRRAIASNDKGAAFHANLGAILQSGGQSDAALAYHRQAIICRPDLAESYSNLGFLLQELQAPDEALRHCRRAVTCAPDFADAHANLGMVLIAATKPGEAAVACRRALVARPGLAIAHNNLGNALQDQQGPDLAMPCFRRALAIRPDYPEAHSNAGAALRQLGRPGPAEVELKRALACDPGFAKAYNNLSTTLLEQGRLQAALAVNLRALYFDEDHAEARANLAMLRLRLGRFAEGWRDYEWRWRIKGAQLPAWTEGKPQWRGEALAGRTIVLHAEQGMGDAIHFCRYAPLVAARGGTVVLQVHRPLVTLLAGLPGVAAVIAKDAPLPPFDLHCPLMSLPGVFGTDLANIPAPIPYLAAEPERVARWRERLPDGFRIGIVWAGSPGYKSDRSRSVPLAQFAPLAGIPGVRLISLQKMHGLDQLDDLPDGMSVATLGEDFDAGEAAFLDSAAVMMSLDLIVTIDSAIGHLAGALGRKVWLILSAVPHWPWLLEREDTPWYPATRLFRQRAPDNWKDVFVRMSEILDESLHGETTPGGPATATMVYAPISVGELLDKITILEIKEQRIGDRAKLTNVIKELAALRQMAEHKLSLGADARQIVDALRRVNGLLWDVEDDIRTCERDQDFGERFITLARSVYRHNDRRALLKKQLNELTGSDLVEEKSYADYGGVT